MQKIKISGSALFLISLLLLPLQSVLAEPVEFEVETADGSLSAKELRGSVVYIDFWASWCAPCRESFPWMNEMHHRYKDKGLKIIAISLDKDRALSDEFLSDLPADFMIGFDPDGELARQFKLIGMPSAYILDRDGELVKKHVGFRNSKREEYEQSIKDILSSQ